MEAVTIEAVELRRPAPGLLGFALDAPRPGEGLDSYSFNVSGWALGDEHAVVAIRVLDGERQVAEGAPGRARRDIAQSFAGAEHAGTCGFEVLVRAIELEPSFELEVVAVLADGAEVPLASIGGVRRMMAVPRTPALAPAMLTTIGRSGSKWLAWLLSCHPEVVAFQPLVFEPRVATYWTTVFRALSAPKSYLRQIHTERWDQQHWWLGEGAVPMPAPIELEMGQWLGVEAVHELAASCQQRTEAFYLEVCERSGKTGARYFAEKFLLEPVLLDLVLECFPGAREIVLVRDFRDRLSSVFAWNEKRGERGFGHDAQMSKAEYLTERVRVDAGELLDRWRRRGAAAHLVRYEDLLLEPRATLKALFEYLEVEAGGSALDELLAVATQPSKLLDSHRTVADPTQTIGRWRRDLPAELAEECNELLADVLDAFGYDTELAGVESAR